MKMINVNNSPSDDFITPVPYFNESYIAMGRLYVSKAHYSLLAHRVTLEFFLNVFTEFSDKNICHYSRRA